MKNPLHICRETKDEVLYFFSEFKHNLKRFRTGIINIFRWIPIIYKDRDFDDGYLLRLEYEKLRRMYNYFKDSNIVVDEWHIALTIKRAMAMLEIILEDDEPYNKYLNDNYGDVTFLDIETSGLDEPLKLPERKLVVPVRVNIRNAYRFANPVDRWYKNRKESTLEKNLRENYGMWAMELRKLKAMHIYYEMRKNYTYEWWD